MDARMKSKTINKLAAALLLISLGLGALVAGWMDPAAFWTGWAAAAFLLMLCIALVWAGWRLAGGGRALAWMVILAFALRLGGGLLLEWGLPRFGYIEKHQLAGYVFADSYARDNQAFTLAQSDRSLGAAFTQEFVTDQYGGLLSLSALVYRYLSPDEHRPYLILILSAGVAAFGIPFLYAAVRRRWGEKVARLAGWILVLYPESVLLGASQMREPYLITFSAIAFWSVVAWPQRRAWAGMAASLAGLLLFSSRAAIPVAGVCAVWFLLERFRPAGAPEEPARPGSRPWRGLAWLGVALAVVAVAAVSWKWLLGNFAWDAYQTTSNSYWVKYILDSLPASLRETLRIPFLVGYGLAQPVLPAALMDPAPLLWQVVGVLRAAGWYALAPFLIYSVLAAFKTEDKGERRVMLWFAIVALAWVVISSFRAGGSQWDNPRYRTILLPWMALLAGWAYAWAQAHKDPWLARILAVEGIFLLFFTEWYFSRYSNNLIPRLPFGVMVGLIVVLSLGVVVGGWFWDRSRGQRSLTQPPEPL